MSKNPKSINYRPLSADEAAERRERRARNVADATAATEGIAEQLAHDAFKELVESDGGS